ncbi:Probable microtubule-binding protein TANGLED [Striga hermonthica]|uniref:Probable microtubule-binding protein TANGLED n=1 Tax=Striga hermonthica TaxID=68872 RepID=A0A9N7MXI6_STRHE|nr:Probable microtubule-binding protein TANGLED [Striga hermonthica]
MSLPAMLLGETMSELVQATQFARNIVQIRKTSYDPKTPPLKRKPMQSKNLEDTWQAMHARRKREKKQTVRVGPDTSSPHAKSKINFKVSSSSSSSPLYKECGKQNCRYVVSANRVSPRNKPWARKTVLFPNPLFHSSRSPTRENKNIPVITRSNHRQIQTPHKFLIKSPPMKSANTLEGRKYEEKVLMEIEKSRNTAHKLLMMQGKIKSPSKTNSSRRITAGSGKKLSPPPAKKSRRSFSPARLANRIVLSPLKLRSSICKRMEGL